MSDVAKLLAGLPTEYAEGEWYIPLAGGPEPEAVITYATEPCPETGREGWCWWAMGKTGEAKTYFDARKQAERVIKAKLAEIHAAIVEALAKVPE